MRIPSVSRALARILLAGAILPAVAAQTEPSKMSYPDAPRSSVVDDYHGTRVADPYRWLEDADSPETTRWVDAQNALTRSALDGPDRDVIRKRLTELYDYPRVSVPAREGRRATSTRATPGLLNQAVLYVREGPSGSERLLLDPNTLTADGTVALTAAAPSHDGSLLAYAISRSGSDRQEILVARRRHRPGPARPPAVGEVHGRSAGPGTTPASTTCASRRRLGARGRRELLRARSTTTAWATRRRRTRSSSSAPEDKRGHLPDRRSRDDGRYLVLPQLPGLERQERGPPAGPRVAGRAARRCCRSPRASRRSYSFAGDVGGRFFFQTNQGAPLGRVIAVDSARSARARRGGARGQGQARGRARSLGGTARARAHGERERPR